MENPVVYWFRNDLRLDDLPGLSAAAASGRPLIACYILDEESAGDWAPGSASRWWLHHSLAAMGDELRQRGGDLLLRRGRSGEVLADIVAESGADSVYCSRQYEPWAARLEAELFEQLGELGVALKRYPGALLNEPEAVANKSGAAFKVFTPFWRHCLQGMAPGAESGLPASPAWARSPAGDALDDLDLRPRNPDWAAGWRELWQPGAAGAQARLEQFLQRGLPDYADGRDRPDRGATSRLSPHLHFGEISPRQVWLATERLLLTQPELEPQLVKFRSELGWREFSHHLLFHFPRIPEQPFRVQFCEFPWLGSPAALSAWQRGMTGYPLVDAGMRELWQTGYMHNRVRMIVASFLTKHLLVHWRAGENWFWDTLLDADLANNASGWQWVAGSGADASPYFRIFNPVTQGQKFDGEGVYVRRWVPELAELPDKYLHQPWEAPPAVLDAAGVHLGENYPEPIVEHRAAREAALAAYGSIKGA